MEAWERGNDRNTARRRGTSLTEVLAAVLIMGVGVLAVMTLFPISILRSIQATQLTNATILSKRADALVEMHRLVTDTYIPQPEGGFETHCVIDPLGWYDMYAVDSSPTGLAHQYGNNGTVPVQYAAPVVQGPLSQPRFVTYGREPFVPSPVLVNAPSGANGFPLRRMGFVFNPFSNLAGAINSAGTLSGPYPAIEPGPFFGASRDTVLATVGLPDTFDQAFVGEPTGVAAAGTSVSFETVTFDLSNVQTSSNIPSGLRVTLFDLTGRRSQVRTFIDGDGDGTADPGTDGVAIALSGSDWVIRWTDPLPSGYGTISEVRVEFPEPRYSWMLTVRKRGTAGGSVTKIDCVVFFNRPTGDPTQEFVYTANQPQVGTKAVTLSYAAGAKPRLKKGGWVFDPQNCVWYRVVEEHKETETATSIDLVLDHSSERQIRNLIVPEGVVSVFPLKSRVDQNRLDTAR